MTEVLIVYGSFGVVWAIYCLGMGYLVSEDKVSSRMLLRGFWLTPIWPIITLVILAYGLQDLWTKAWGSELP